MAIDPESTSPNPKQVEDAPTHEESEGAGTVPEQAPTRILIIDDSVTVRMSLRDLLSGNGYEVLLADDGSEVPGLLGSERVDILMMDLVLPGGGSGRDLLKEIRADDSLASVSVILLTAVSNRDQISECREIGIAGVFAKPWEEAHLLAGLAELVQRKLAGNESGGVLDHDDTLKLDIEEKPEVRPRVLVVDDSMTIRFRLTEDLQASGMEVVAKERAQDALLLVQREEFDVAITDIVMPCMDGEELIGRLARLAPDLPCIVLTGSAEMSVVRRLAAARNVVGILVKPWKRERLIDTMMSALVRRETEPVKTCS